MNTQFPKKPGLLDQVMSLLGAGILSTILFVVLVVVLAPLLLILFIWMLIMRWRLKKKLEKMVTEMQTGAAPESKKVDVRVYPAEDAEE
jgi:hypothetical protein